MKYFGLGLITGAVLGAVIGFVKNPQTGNTIKHDFKQQIDETIVESNNIKDAKKQFDSSLDYLKTDGTKLINDTIYSLNDRVNGFNQQIEPNLSAIEENLAALDETLESSKM